MDYDECNPYDFLELDDFYDDGENDFYLGDPDEEYPRD